MNETQRIHFMPRTTTVTVWHACVVLACLCLPLPSASSQSYVNFEGKQTNPVRVSPDGTRLFVVNTPGASVSVFDLADPAKPELIAEIPVGIEPVSVNPRSSDEGWVVNEVSDSVSVVSVSQGIVMATLPAKDEPMDVVFSGNRAFVSVGRSNELAVFDTDTRVQLLRIPLKGLNPRALAVSPDGSKVYVAFALSGNRTTIIPKEKAPPQAAPTNIQDPAPRVALIVDAEDPAWAEEIQYTMPDNDVAEIDVASLTVIRYFPRLGTVNLGLGVNPRNGDLWVANTDARNVVFYEPVLRGYTHFNRVTHVEIASGAATPFDLNPDVDYSIMPNLEARAKALAQPTAVLFDPSGDFFYIASFGTDRVAKIDTEGNVIERIEVGDVTGAAADPRHMRGPRGLALSPQGAYLYVMNRISNTISVIDTAAGTVIDEFSSGSYDPTPAVVREGRGFLYDARLSGNGTLACASCHIDAEMDHLAWDLGDPGGALQTLTVTPDGITTHSHPAHPMKGPMTTQTLRGLKGLDPLHWRGDRDSFLAFNPAFNVLMGAEPLPDEDMQAYRDFIETIIFAPNPHRNLDNGLPETLGSGSPRAGESYFRNTSFSIPAIGQSLRCTDCHSHPTGVDARVQFRIGQNTVLDIVQPMKIPQLRSVYQKNYFDNEPGAESLAGFGFEHDGVRATIAQAHTGPRFESIQDNETVINNLTAFLMCFDTGTVPAIGYSRTITGASVDDPDVVAEWDVLIEQASRKNIDLIVHGKIGDAPVSYLYHVTRMKYQRNRTRTSFLTHANLVAEIRNGATVTLMGVPLGSGQRMALDRDEDGILNGDEL